MSRSEEEDVVEISTTFLSEEGEEPEVKVEKVEEELVSEVAADSTVDSALELVIPRI